MKKNTIIILLLLFSCKAEKIIDPPIKINKTIKLVTPMGGESFLTVDTLNINWLSENISQINILYNYDGSSWQDTVYKVDASLNSYQIEPPLKASDSCLIKIIAIDDTTIYDVSKDYFRIINSPIEKVLELISPNGGEIFYIGDTLKIEWNSKNIESVNLLLSRDNGISWENLKENIDSTMKAYDFIIHEPVSEQALVKIVSNTDSSLYDISKNYFRIINSPIEQVLELISPNGGEIFYIGDTLKIEWNSKNIESVNLLLSRDNGISWENLKENIDSTVKAYDFIIHEPVSEQALVKIVSNTDPSLYDISEMTFSIVTLVEPVLEYFPLEIGNIYVYSVEQSTYPNWQPENFKERVTIIGKTAFNGLEYYDFKTETSNMNSSHSYYRIDETTQTIYKYNDYAPNTDYSIAQLSLSDGSHSLPNMKTVVVSTSEQTIFGTSDSVKNFDFYEPFNHWKYDFAKGFGFFNKWESNESWESNRELSGCVINNEVYGDTTLFPPAFPADSLKYYPLTTGDYYVFADTLIKWGQADLITKVKKEIVDEVSINNQLYYKIVETNSEDTNSSNIYYERVSEDGKIYRIDGNTVRIIDDLSTDLNEKNYFYRYGFYDGWTSYNEFVSYSLVNIVGTNYYSRNYYTVAGGEFDAQYSLLYNFGLYQYKVHDGNDASIRKGKLIGGKNNNINWGQYQFP